jgi:uncharacterized GH25 family protein
MPGCRVPRWLLAATLVATVADCSFATAQTREATPPRPVPLRPRIDTSAVGAIAGRIVSAEDGRPLRHAQIKVQRADSPSEPQSVLTDDEGRFQVSALLAGFWTLTVSKAGYVPLTSGQRHSSATSRLRVTAGQLTAFDAALVRGGAITGAVIDEFGDPIAGAAVQALRARLVDGERRLTAVATDQSDDTGAFRLHSLPAGEYYVSARTRATAPEDAGGLSSALDIFYPGTSNIGEARRVSIRPGDERDGISFALLPSYAVRISGTVIDSTGRAVDEASVELVDPSDGKAVAHPFGNFGLTHDGGRFTFINVSPGGYLISALVDRPNSSYEERALVPVTVSSGDVTDTTVTTTAGGTITGSVATTSGAPLPRTWRAQLSARSGYGIGPPHRTTIAAGQTFTLGGVSGPTSFDLTDLPTGWVLQRIEINGTDVTDGTIDVSPGTPMTARIIMTNAVAPLTGVVLAGDKAMADVAVVVFAAEPTKWTVPSRFVKATRTDAEGRFSLAGLPASNYLVFTSSDLEDDEYLDVDMLLRLRSRATPVTLTEGAPAAVRLTLGAAP